MLLAIEFQEAYKRLDKLCKECFASKDGVTEYIRIMESEYLGEKYVPTWKIDLKELKHIRWVRNQLSHEVGTLQSDICSQNDLNYVEYFYKKIIERNDPLALLRKEREAEKRKEYKQFQYASNKPAKLASADTNRDKRSLLRRIWEKIKSFFV